MRCPDCNKFVGLEEADPEVDSIDVDDEGNVAIEVRITNNCADCGMELREATFSLEHDHSEDCKEHKGVGHELSIDEDGAERTSRSGFFDKKKNQFVSAGGRYSKTFYGAEVGYSIKCSCGKLSVDGSISDDIQASSMDEM